MFVTLIILVTALPVLIIVGVTRRCLHNISLRITVFLWVDRMNDRFVYYVLYSFQLNKFSDCL